MDWAEANQRYLVARVAIVLQALARHAGGPDLPKAEASTGVDRERALREAAEAMPAPAALDTLCGAFGLSPFERDLLLLCAGVELESSLAALCASCSPAGRASPTFGMALAALPDPHWSAITPAAPLRRWRFIEIGSGDSLVSSALKIDERVLHYLAGVSYLDDRLQGLVEYQPPPKDMPPSHRSLAARIAALWARTDPEAPPVICLGGYESSGKRAVAAFACAHLDLQLHVLDAAGVPSNLAEREALARLWEREAVLQRGALLIDCDEPDNQRSALSFAQQTRGYLFLAGRAPVNLRSRLVAHLEVNKPETGERLRLWRETLGQLAFPSNGEIEGLVSQFDLGAEQILAAGVQALADSADEQQCMRRLWQTCRIGARGHLDDLAQRLEPMATWSDLVLPPALLEILQEIAAQVRQRLRVYETWGFASKGTRGLGISALFAGASGTGKTMAAEVLAAEVGLDLYRIDLSQVVSKYIGETEKNLRRVFDAAEAGGAVLLFDEADALFGKRSEVKDSHDRYANVEISYLLQRMESYRGLAILTTNMKNALDAAFLRRLRFIVQFPFPNSAQRAQIWQHVYPKDVPVENLDVEKLSRLNVAGGSIRNIALHAAFLAAESDEPVRMGHLLRAARSEYAKSERQLTEGECKDWM
jgi:hypothetical protein